MLSPEIIAAAEKIDPNNGWFQGLVAAGMADGVVSREKQSTKDREEGNAAVMTIHDEARLQKVLTMIHQIAAKPRFTSYQIDLLRQRIPLLPPRRNFVSQFPLLMYVISLKSIGSDFRRLPDALAASVRQCAAKGDVDGFLRIIGDWRALVTHSIKGGGTMIDLLVAKASITGPAPNFRDAARALGLEDEARYFSDLDERARKQKEKRRIASVSASGELYDHRALTLASLTVPLMVSLINSPPTLTEMDLRPGRYAEYALFEHVISWPA